MFKSVIVLVLIFLFIPSSRCQSNLTYVFSHVNTSLIELYLRPTGWFLTNLSHVKHLPTIGVNFLNSTEVILAANDIQSIAVSWNTGYCSYAVALAERYPWISVSNALCFTTTYLSISNLFQLTITIEQLAQSAAVFLNYYSVTYFSIITSLSNDFYPSLAQEFATQLTKSAYILEQFLFSTRFPPTSSALRSKGQPKHSIRQQFLVLFFFKI